MKHFLWYICPSREYKSLFSETIVLIETKFSLDIDWPLIDGKDRSLGITLCPAWDKPITGIRVDALIAAIKSL